MQALLVVVSFGALHFLSNAAALALEPQAPGIWHLSLVLLGAFNCASGFMVLGGVSAIGEGLWATAAACGTAGAASAILTWFGAAHLVRVLDLDLPVRLAPQIVTVALGAGFILLIVSSRLDQLPPE